MRKNSGLLFLIVCFLFYFTEGPMAYADMRNIVWKNVSRGIGEIDLQTVAVSPDNADTVYVSSFDAIYKTLDGGNRWDEVLSFRSTGNAIYSIVITPGDTKIVYAGGDGGLYRSNDSGMSWENIFRVPGDMKSSILSIAVDQGDNEAIFIGSKSGLYYTENRGKDWKKARDISSGVAVSSIVIDRSDPDVIYAATGKGLYKSLNKGSGWKRIYETHRTESKDYILNELERAEIAELKSATEIRSIAIDPADTQIIYTGTSRGLLLTGDGGLTWKMTGSSGLISRDIRHIAVTPADIDGVYAATSRGVFRYSRTYGSWEELYKGLAPADIRFISFSPPGPDELSTLWAVTKKGVFKTVPVRLHANYGRGGMSAGEVLAGFDYEPSIEEIQEAAIVHAEVHPEKIKKWRKAAARRAWLPDLRVGYDNGVDWQSSTYFYSTSKEKYTDNDITKGRDRGWSLSLSWELGDLIWNNDQTSIDTRSRLMVQLRDDVLNEITRLYFERRKLQVEMLLWPPTEITESVDMELRLQGLTAGIDALTGSYLSKRLQQARDKEK
ncbi:MAG: hypothetical protein KAJ10_00305 [Thermodesulfovibrionia bacterium]|nr:hypothetical protein [Thermodesulfovibrionia bacterium]